MSEFNIGDRVNYHALIDGPVTSTGHEVTHIASIPSSNNVPMVWISGKAGCVHPYSLSLDTAATNHGREIVSEEEYEDWVQCWQCGGEGVTHHECLDDTCVCLEPLPNVSCDVCRGDGGWIRNTNSTT